MTPAERREILEYERRKRVANEIIREAVAAREKTRKLVTGPSFQRGILGVDNATNEQSEIYGAEARAARDHSEYKAITHLERKSNIATRTSSFETNGNILVPDSIASRVKIEKYYQSKGATNTLGLSFDETHNRLFNRRMDRAPNIDRTLYIRDQELSGKQYNIVTHAMIEQWPARSFFHREKDPRMDHPSQGAALEGPRNLQGTLLKDKKF